MKRIVEIDGHQHEFDLARANGNVLANFHEFIVYSTDDRGWFVREGGDLLGVAVYGYIDHRWTVYTDLLPGCFQDEVRVFRTLGEACELMWRRREERVKRWRDELDVAEAISFSP